MKKKTNKGAQRRRKRGGGGAAERDFVSQVCAITNPFCSEAQSAKLPDADASDSITLWSNTRNVVPISTVAGAGFDGEMCCVVSSAENFPNYYAADNATDWLGTANVDPSSFATRSYNTPMSDSFSSWRYITGALVLKVTASAASNEGIIRVTPLNSDVAIDYLAETNANAQLNFAKTREYTAYEISRKGGLYLPFTISNPIVWQEYDSGKGMIQTGLAAYHIYGYGLSTSAQVYAEVWCYCEGRPSVGSVTHRLQTPAAKSNPMLLAAAGDVAMAAAEKVMNAPWRETVTSVFSLAAAEVYRTRYRTSNNNPLLYEHPRPVPNPFTTGQASLGA